MIDERHGGPCVTRRGLIRVGLGVAGLALASSAAVVIPAWATDIGEQVYVTGDYEIVGWQNFRDAFTKHTDANTGEPVFCVEHNYSGGTGWATTRELVGQTTRQIHFDDARHFTRTWTEESVTDAALIVECCLGGHLGPTGDDAYVLAQAYVWAYIDDWSLENAAGWDYRLPVDRQGHAPAMRSWVLENRSKYEGHGMLYAKDSEDQACARFWVTPRTGVCGLGKEAANPGWI